MNGREHFIDPNELSKYLQIKPHTLHIWTKTKALPYYKIGGRLRFKISEIDKWVGERQRQKRSRI